MNHKVQTVLHTSIKPGRCHESRRQTRRHHFRRTTLAVMALLLFCLCLGGCIRTFDCSGYIQGMLDATYKGECDDYAAATHSEVSDIMQDYNDFIAHETDIFLHFCGLTADDVIPEDLTQQLTGDLQDIYRQVRYTVNEADRDGNVTVDIEPLDLYNSVYEEFSEFNEAFRGTKQ